MPMIICFPCPSGHLLQVSSDLVGKKVRCGLCRRITVVPAPPPMRRPPVSPRPASSPQPRPTPPPKAAKSPTPSVSPPRKPVLPPRPAAAPSLPPAAEPPLVSSSLAASPVVPPTVEEVARPVVILEDEPTLGAKTAFEIGGSDDLISPLHDSAHAWGQRPSLLSRFARMWPAPAAHLPADVTEPGPEETRKVLKLAAVLIATVLLSLLPAAWLGHFNLGSAPGWARLTVLLAALQIACLAWMINAPDWAAVRVQMVLSTAIAALYGMVMTLTMSASSPLILGLDEVRRLAPAWSALMLAVMGTAIWLCGRTIARWRRELRP